MKLQSSALLASLFAASCAQKVVTQARSFAGETLPKDSGLSVSLRTLLVTGAGERSVAESETLHTGDRVYFLLRTSQPAYLYVVLYGADGAPTTLWPDAAAGEQRIAADCPLRVPAAGSFYLQAPAGVEDLRAVASAAPLVEADRRLCQQLGLPCKTPQAAPAAPPSCEAMGTRAVYSAVKVATASARGVASLRVTLRHDP